MTELEPAEARLRRAHLGLAAGVTAAAALTYLVTLLLSWSELPTTMATHFGLGGQPDRLMPTVPAVILQGLIVIGVPLSLLVVFSATRWWRGEFSRSFSAVLCGLSAGLSAMFVLLILKHRGVADPTLVTLGADTALTIFGVAVAVGAIVALSLPKPLPRAEPTAVEPLVLTPTTRTSWFGRASMNHLGLAVLTAGVIVLVIAALLSNLWWLWLIVALMIVLVLGMTSFDVKVDASGVTWRAALGAPSGHIDLAAIDGAAVVDVSPGDYGGLGLRALPGRLGIITRSGPALLVRHANRQFVATVDDPVGAAALIEGLRVGTASRPPQDD